MWVGGWESRTAGGWVREPDRSRSFARSMTETAPGVEAREDVPVPGGRIVLGESSTSFSTSCLNSTSTSHRPLRMMKQKSAPSPWWKTCGTHVGGR